MRLLDIEAGALALSIVGCLSLNQVPPEAALHCDVKHWNYVATEGNIQFNIRSHPNLHLDQSLVAIQYTISTDDHTFTLADTFDIKSE